MSESEGVRWHMNFERKSDMLAWQWDGGGRDYELMLSLELGRWALPLAIEHGGYEGTSGKYICTHRTSTLRVLCGAIHFTWDRVSESEDAHHG